MEATVFFARFSEKALPPRQWSAQIMKPSAEAAGDASAAPKPGNAIAPPAPPRVDSRRAGEEVRGKDMRARAAPRAPWRIAIDAVVDSISLTWGSCEFNLRLLVLLGRVPDMELGTGALQLRHQSVISPMNVTSSQQDIYRSVSFNFFEGSGGAGVRFCF